MSHKGKVSAEEKLRIVEDYLAGKVGYSETVHRAGVCDAAIRLWVRLYKTEGPSGLEPQGKPQIQQGGEAGCSTGVSIRKREPARNLREI